jgi:hypothetical protein
MGTFWGALSLFSVCNLYIIYLNSIFVYIFPSPFLSKTLYKERKKWYNDNGLPCFLAGIRKKKGEKR